MTTLCKHFYCPPPPPATYAGLKNVHILSDRLWGMCSWDVELLQLVTAYSQRQQQIQVILYCIRICNLLSI